MTVLVTGGAGFIGSHLIDLLLEQGRDVVAFDRTRGRNLDRAGEQPAFRFVEGDIRDADACSRLVAEADLVFHLSAVVGVGNYLADPLNVIDVNVIGTRNVIRAAVECDTRLVFTSTSEVFGRNPRVPWSEDDDRVLGSTSVDRWSYSTSKALGEHMVLAAHGHHDLPVTVVRFFNAYGPRQAPGYVVSETVRRVLRGEPPLVYDGGKQTRCFTYVGDAVAGTLLAGASDAAIGEVFNIGSSTETAIREAVELVIEVSGTTIDAVDFVTSSEFGNVYEDIDRRVPDTSKAQRVLGWETSTSLREGVAQTLRWAEANPWWVG